MRIAVGTAPGVPTQVLRLGGRPSNVLIQNTGGPQQSVVGATNGNPDIAYESGAKFNVNWSPGTEVLIGGAIYQIQSVTSTTALVLTSNFTGTTSTSLPFYVLANVYLSDSPTELSGPTANGAPQTGLIIGTGGSLSLQNWSSDLYGLTDSGPTNLEVVVNVTGSGSIQNPSATSGGASGSGGAAGAGGSGGHSRGGAGQYGGGSKNVGPGKGGSTF